MTTSVGSLTDLPDAVTQGRALQSQIDSDMTTLEASVAAGQLAGKLDAATVTAWKAYYASWRDFVNHDPGLGMAILSVPFALKVWADRMTQMKTQWRPQTDAWSLRIASTAGLVGPTKPPPPAPSWWTLPHSLMVAGGVAALGVLAAVGVYFAASYRLSKVGMKVLPEALPHLLGK